MVLKEHPFITGLLAAVAVFGLALAAFYNGFEIGKSTLENSTKFLETKNEDLEKINKNLDQQVKRLLVETQRFVSQAATQSAMTTDIKNPPKTQNQGPDNKVLEISTDKDANIVISETVIVEQNTSAAVDNGNLFIAVESIELSGSPLSYELRGSIGAPNQKNIKIDGVRTNHVENKFGYEVRILNLSTLSATFLIRKLR